MEYSMDGLSARLKAATYTGQHKQRKSGEAFMLWELFEPTIAVFERAKILHALDRTYTVNGSSCLAMMIMKK
jgi:hypothetical protein